MTKSVLYSIGIIAVFQVGDVLMSSNNVWIGVAGIGVSVLGLGLTGVFIFKRAPILYKEIKLRLGR